MKNNRDSLKKIANLKLNLDWTNNYTTRSNLGEKWLDYTIIKDYFSNYAANQNLYHNL